MEKILERLIASQEQTSAALTAMANAIATSNSFGQRNRITNRPSAGRGGRGRGGNQSRQGQRAVQAQQPPIIAEVRDVASQKVAAERATSKGRIRNALRQMSLSIFSSDSWSEVKMRRWYNAALRAFDALNSLNFPAGEQRESFFEQCRQVAFAFNIGAKAEEPPFVIKTIAMTIMARSNRDAFYEDGHVKIQDGKGQPFKDDALGYVPLPGFSNVRLEATRPQSATSQENKPTGYGWEILSSLDSEFRGSQSDLETGSAHGEEAATKVAAPQPEVKQSAESGLGNRILNEAAAPPAKESRAVAKAAPGKPVAAKAPPEPRSEG